MADRVVVCEEVVAQGQRLQLGQVREVLDFCYLVARQVQDFQFWHVKVLDDF